MPINAQLELPEALRQALGGAVRDVMARNVSAEWYVVRSQVEKRTQRVDERFQ